MLSVAAGTIANVRLVAIAVLALACTPVAGTPTAPPSGTSSAVATATQTRAPERSPNVTVTGPIGTLPRDFAYVETSPTDATLWLVDLSGVAAPTAVVRWTLGSHTSSVSRDGTAVVIEARGTRSVVGIDLVRPLTGEASVLYEGSADARALYAKMSPDGRTVAFTLGHERDWDGVWLVDVASGATRQLLRQPTSTPLGPVEVIGWSDDSQWVTYLAQDDANPGAGTQLFIHHVADGRRIAIGQASLASWTQSEPRLLVAHVGGKGNQGAFGATISAYDVTRGSSRELVSIQPRIDQIAWSENSGRFLYLSNETGCPFGSAIWTSAPGATAWQVGRVTTADAAWWSKDGTIYALVRGAGTTANVINAFTGQAIASLQDAAPARGCDVTAPTRTGVATVCGTITQWDSDGAVSDGSLTLTSPGREPIALTIPAGRAGGRAAGYVCVGVVAGSPRPLFEGFAVSATALFVDEGRTPASVASPSPAGFVIPQSCAYVAAPVVGTDQTDWALECGAANDRDARAFLGSALGQQGWTLCGSGVAAAQWKKNGVMLGIAESSLAPGDHPRLTQFTRLLSPC